MKNIKHHSMAAIICFIGGFFVLFQFLVQGSTSLMVPELMQSLCINLTQVGFLSSAFFYPYILLQIPSGALVDRFGPRNVLLGTTIILALGTFAFSFCDCFASANTTRALMGVASAPGVACAMYLAARWYPNKFTIVAGLLEMMGMIGGASGDYLLSYLTQGYGWRTTMIVCSAIGIGLFIAILIFVRNGPKNQMAKAKAIPGEPKENKTWENLKSILGNKEIWKVCLYGGLVFAIISAFASLWAIPFLSILYSGISSHDISKATALIFIGAAVGAGISGYLANKSSPKTIKIIFSLIATASFAMILYLPVSFGFMQALFFLLGVCSGTYILPFGSVEAQTSEEAKGLAMGFTNMIIIGLGGPILQPVIGWMINAYTSHNLECGLQATLAAYQFAFLPILIGLALAVVLSFCMRTKSKPA